MLVRAARVIRWISVAQNLFRTRPHALHVSRQSDVLPAAELRARNAAARQKRGSQFRVVWFAPSERVASPARRTRKS